MREAKRPAATETSTAVGTADSAFAAEAVAHLPQLRKASAALAGNRSDAEDLVQDAYVRALGAEGRFQPGTNLKAWLFTILRNLARNRRRDAHRARLHEDDGGSPLVERSVSPALSPEDHLVSAAFAPELQAALESLPKSLRDAVWLRDVEELSYADIATRLRIPIGTVMSRISRGRRLLHDRLTTRGQP